MPRLSSPRIVTRRVFEARADVGLTQEALARRMRCATVTVQAWEAGLRNPSPKMLARLAKATGKPEEFFLDTTPTEGVAA